MIGILASSSKFHHGFDFVHGVLGFQLRVRLIEGFRGVDFRFWLSGVESVGQRRCDQGFLTGSTPVLGVIDQGFRFWGPWGSELQLDQRWLKSALGIEW